MNKTSNTSTRLKEIMQERGLKQVDILKYAKPYCKKYNTPLNRNDLSQYVSGKNEPGQKKIMILAEALNVSPAWLMGLDVPRDSSKILNLSEGKDEYELFILLLRKKGFLKENEEMTNEDLNKLIDFAIANKQFIMKNDDEK